ncbi:hypothetical protein GALMADRAFT_133971 [Galerina marginata CBS 339.88]|uniref:Pre-rRNA-processing protein TSR2 n=1 Tax=Galerina marginata (strain CBS 339.88) TaxID=685588 RepID=A0A067TQY8_GALM3|nr:hypothetical protein GALMADRAFT_133971 [Galerina marginata CBS 339.88]
MDTDLEMEPPQTTAPPATSVLFARGVIARLATWEILRIAIQENWGGSSGTSKRTWLAGVIVDSFEEQIPTPDDQYIEELLLQVMADEFDAVLEDGSAEGVAQDIVRLWEVTRLSKQDLVLKFEERADKVKGKKLDAKVADDTEEWEDDEDGEDDEEEEEVPQLLEHPRASNPREPEIDEDGFTLTDLQYL